MEASSAGLLRYANAKPDFEKIRAAAAPYSPTHNRFRGYLDDFHREIASYPVNGCKIEAEIAGWLQQADALKLYELAYYATGDILEFGTNNGLSAFIMARAIQATGGGRKVITMEIDSFCAAVARENLAQRGLSPFVEIWLGDANETCRQFIAQGARFNFAFVDHSHLYEDMRAACAALDILMNPGALVLFHDFTDPLNRFPPFTGRLDEYGIFAAITESLPPDFAFFGCVGCSALYWRTPSGSPNAPADSIPPV
jgi:hypothetical protein